MTDLVKRLTDVLATWAAELPPSALETISESRDRIEALEAENENGTGRILELEREVIGLRGRIEELEARVEPLQPFKQRIVELEEASLFKSNRIAGLVKDYTELQRKCEELEQARKDDQLRVNEQIENVLIPQITEHQRKYEALRLKIGELAVDPNTDAYMECKLRALLESDDEHV